MLAWSGWSRWFGGPVGPIGPGGPSGPGPPCDLGGQNGLGDKGACVVTWSAWSE